MKDKGACQSEARRNNDPPPQRLRKDSPVIYNSIQENHGLKPVDELNADMSSSLG